MKHRTSVREDEMTEQDETLTIEIPEAAVEAVATNMMNRYEQEYTLAPDATWRNWEEFAKEDLAAALPIILPAVVGDYAQQVEVLSGILKGIATGDMEVTGLGEDGEPTFHLTEQGVAHVEAMGGR